MSAAPLGSCVYAGRVRHRRFAPVAHAFSYGLFMVCLDLAELPRVFRGRWLWSVGRPNVASFRREDHLGDPAVDLDQAVRDLVAARLGRRPAGAIRLLTHLRYLGFVFNPVSFFYVHDAEGRLDAVVAEVTNTPWNERHAYVLDAAAARAQAGLEGGRVHRFRLAKAFHVSPFMSMAQEYEWRLGEPGRRLTVHMLSREAGADLFDATLTLSRRPLDGWTLARALLSVPPVTLKVVLAIYWNALRLWWKRAPFFPHPARRTPAAAPTPEEP